MYYCLNCFKRLLYTDKKCTYCGSKKIYNKSYTFLYGLPTWDETTKAMNEMFKMIIKMKKIKLDKYEQEIIDAYEKEEIESISNVKKEMTKYREYAKYALQKNNRIKINSKFRTLQEHEELREVNKKKYDVRSPHER